MNSMLRLAGHARSIRGYLLAAAALFLISMLLGARTDILAGLIQQNIESVQAIAEGIQNAQYPKLYAFVVIFLNNTVKCIIIVFAGAFLGVIPFFFLLINGMLLGSVLTMGGESAKEVIALAARGILPHGIIEIPVLILAGGYGMYFGVLLMKLFIQLFVPSHKRTAEREMGVLLRMTLPLMVFMVIALFLAALIESTITVWLVGGL